MEPSINESSQGFDSTAGKGVQATVNGHAVLETVCADGVLIDFDHLWQWSYTIMRFVTNRWIELFRHGR